LALLSKYTAILLLPCLLIYLLLTEDRRWLKTFYPYLAVLAGLLCFFPVVYWNSQHEWVSFAFQLEHGLGGHSYSLDRMALYFGGQLLVAGPIAPLLGIYAAFAYSFRKNKAQLFLILTALPVIMIFGFSSIKKLAGPNWPVFAYFTFSILVTKYFLDSTSRMLRSLWYAALLASISVSAIVTLQAKFSVLPLASYSKELAVADATNWFYGWRELGAELIKYPDMEFAVAPSHQLAAEIMYYTNEKLFVQTDERARPSQFNLWSWPAGLKGKNGFYVWAEGDAIGPYAKYFSSTTGIDTLQIFRDGLAVRSFHIVPGHSSLILPVPDN
jgi:4-amino-4-deoxy-L-arabinose transferase-like glycosyltransferase